MDLDRIIRELTRERDRIQRIIDSLEVMALETDAGRRTGGRARREERRGRKFMGEAERQQVSLRMKKYWAENRQKKAGDGTD